MVNYFGLILALAIALYIGRLILISALSPIQAAAEKNAKFSELNAIYLQDIARHTYQGLKERNGRGELMMWRDPTEYWHEWHAMSYEKRTERRTRHEEEHGERDRAIPGTDVGPEAERIKAESAIRDAEWEAMMVKMFSHLPAEEQERLRMERATQQDEREKARKSH